MDVVKPTQYITDPLFDISGQVYLIAGSSGGLGRVIAKSLAERGAKLTLGDLSADGLERMTARIPDAIAQVIDITDETSVSVAVARTVQHYGRLDGAINAAGIWAVSLAESFDETTFRQCIDVNLTGAFLFSRAAARAMSVRGGRIINIASVSSLVANPEYAAYASSKAAVSQMVRVLAREWATKNVLINAIGPAMTETQVTSTYLSDQDLRAKAIASIPMGRLGEPEDIIAMILLLLSAGGRFITGQTIYVDGGRTLV